MPGSPEWGGRRKGSARFYGVLRGSTRFYEVLRGSTRFGWFCEPIHFSLDRHATCTYELFCEEEQRRNHGGQNSEGVAGLGNGRVGHGDDRGVLALRPRHH